MCPSNLVGVGCITMENHPLPHIHVSTSFFDRPACSALTITSKRKIRSLWNLVGISISYVGLELVWSFSRIRQVAPHFQISLPVLITWLQWPRLPSPRLFRPIGLVWDLISYYRLQHTFGLVWMGFLGENFLGENFYVDLTARPVRSLQPGLIGYHIPSSWLPWCRLTPFILHLLSVRGQYTKSLKWLLWQTCCCCCCCCSCCWILDWKSLLSSSLLEFESVLKVYKFHDSPGGANSTRAGELRWALPRISSSCFHFAWQTGGQTDRIAITTSQYTSTSRTM